MSGGGYRSTGHNGTAWSEDDIIFLEENWGKMKASKIGVHLGGRTKASVVGKAHRLGMPHLIAQPIKTKQPTDGLDRVSRRKQQQREYERRRREARKAGVPWTCRAPANTLTPLQSLIALANQLSKGEIAPMPPKKEKVVPRSARIVLGEMHQCSWPIGDPGTPSFKFCCEPAERGKSYCEEHRKIAYVPRPRERVW